MLYASFMALFAFWNDLHRIWLWLHRRSFSSCIPWVGGCFCYFIFGLGSVLGTYHLLTIGESENLGIVTIIGFSLGLVINNLLVVNNYRDFENDKLVRKNTTVVLFGKKFGSFCSLWAFCSPTFLHLGKSVLLAAKFYHYPWVI